MRFLLDTNILLPLEDSQLPLKNSLANFVRLSSANGHELIYHPASEDDINRDSNQPRKTQTLQRLKQYSRLNDIPACPWNDDKTTPNDKADNEILYAIYCEAAHALITEDKGLHRKAKDYGVSDKVYNVQTAEDWLKRLYDRTSVKLPNIEEVGLHRLIPHLESSFFDSLREGYNSFNEWFKRKSRDGKAKAWVVWEADKTIGALCIYDVQTNEKITDEGLILEGDALKLCTFKVAQSMRGKKTGELFLKAAFRYASANNYQHLFIHGEIEQHSYLFNLLEDFGFEYAGADPKSSGKDAVYVKKHPTSPPDYQGIPPFDYLKTFFPHFQRHEEIKKYIIPIKPEFHKILFPDFISNFGEQLSLFELTNNAGNAIKLAYLSHANSSKIKSGDIVLFYRSEDEQSITSIGVVEEYKSSKNATEIAQLVSRRTVYTMLEIENMTKKPTKVILFRLVMHFKNPVQYNWLIENKLIKGRIQSIQAITHTNFERVLEHAGI